MIFRIFSVLIFFVFTPIFSAATPDLPLLIPGLHIAELPEIGFYELNGSRAEANKGPVRVKLDLLKKYEDDEAFTLPLIARKYNRDSVLVSMGVEGRYLRLVKVDVEGAQPVKDLATAVKWWKEYLSGEVRGNWRDFQLKEISLLGRYALLVLRSRVNWDGAVELQALEEREEEASWCTIS